MAHVSGTSPKDYLRFVPGLKKLLPKIIMSFSEVSPASEYWHTDAKITAKKLENKYYGRVNNIKL